MNQSSNTIISLVDPDGLFTVQLSATTDFNLKEENTGKGQVNHSVIHKLSLIHSRWGNLKGFREGLGSWQNTKVQKVLLSSIDIGFESLSLNFLGIKVQGDNSSSDPKYTIEDILEKASEAMEMYNYEVAQHFCQRALEMDNDNVKALEVTSSLLLEVKPHH